MTDAFGVLAARMAVLDIPHRRDVSLAPLTTLGVGGRVPVLAEPQIPEQVAAGHREAARLGIRLETLGSGANLLASDGVLPMAVLRLASMEPVEIRDGVLTAGAGAPLEGVIRKAVEAGLAGLEGLVGIPATVGGAVAMNAGGRHGEISDQLVRITTAGAEGLRTLSKAECGFHYRRAAIGKTTVLSAEFRLAPGRPADLRERARAIRDEKRRTQPLQEASAGCIFRNPPPPGDSAGRLIETAGLKGLREGPARVSDVHANFLVNEGGATADDVLRLIDRLRDGVRRAHGVELQLEVVRWP